MGLLGTFAELAGFAYVRTDLKTVQHFVFAQNTHVGHSPVHVHMSAGVDSASG